MRALESLYEETRSRIKELVVPLGRAAASTRLPACPAWSVHDVVAHMTVACSDILSGNIQGAASDEWTAAQVDARRATSLEELLAEWDEVAPKYAAVIDDFPGQYRRQAVGDVAVHEQDIRGALGRPGARDSLPVEVSTDFLVTAIVDPGARALGLGPVAIHSGDRAWVVGTGEPPSGEPEAAIAAALLSTGRPPPPPLPHVAGVQAAPFELFRALTGRRSAAQVRRFGWTGDPEPHLALFGLWPFTLRTTDLDE